MAFKLVNPYWLDPVAAKAAQHKAAVQTYLQANVSGAANRAYTLAELRAALPAIAADLSRGVVLEIARLLSAQVEDAGSNDA